MKNAGKLRVRERKVKNVLIAGPFYDLHTFSQRNFPMECE